MEAAEFHSITDFEEETQLEGSGSQTWQMKPAFLWSLWCVLKEENSDSEFDTSGRWKLRRLTWILPPASIRMILHVLVVTSVPRLWSRNCDGLLGSDMISGRPTFHKAPSCKAFAFENRQR